MFINASSAVRCVVATLLLSLPASAALARGDAGAPVAVRSAPAPVAPLALADQIDSLLDARFMAASHAPSTDTRRVALQDLSHFAALTVEGLIEAAPRGEMRDLMDARLRPILARHQENIGAALAALAAPTARPSAQNTSAQGVYGRSTLTGLPRMADGP